MKKANKRCKQPSVPLRLAKLGVSKFETKEDASRRQRQMIRALERAGFDLKRYADLANCGANGCGRPGCAEVCQIGARQRRIKAITAVHRLLKRADGPICLVRVVRGVWKQPVGSLAKVSIPAVKQLNRRALDKLYNPALIAVGMVKVSLHVDPRNADWLVEIRQLVAGATKEELEQVYSTRRYNPQSVEFVRVKEVKDLGPAISDVSRYRLDVFENVLGLRFGSPPNKTHRAEFYGWLLGLDVNARMLRYGCDKYLNPITKQPRTIPLKIPKKRRQSYRLEAHKFGQAKWRDLHPSEQTFKPKLKTRPTQPPPDYFDDV